MAKKSITEELFSTNKKQLFPSSKHSLQQEIKRRRYKFYEDLATNHPEIMSEADKKLWEELQKEGRPD